VLADLGADDEVNANIDSHRALQVIEGMGGNPDASFTIKHHLFSEESCQKLIEYTDKYLEMDKERDLPVDTPLILPHGTDSWYNFDHHNDYNKKITAVELVDLIGEKETRNLLDFFYDHNGYDEDPDCMYLSRHASPEEHDGEVFYNPFHMDTYSTVEVQLNNNIVGGDIIHLSRDGAHKHEAFPGTALTHGTDSVHGSTPQHSGTRYMFILKHHFDRPDKSTVISHEIVDKIVAAKATTAAAE
jgi:hypothetical protein